MKIIKAILQFIWEGGSYPPGGYMPPPYIPPKPKALPKPKAPTKREGRMSG